MSFLASVWLFTTYVHLSISKNKSTPFLSLNIPYKTSTLTNKKHYASLNNMVVVRLESMIRFILLKFKFSLFTFFLERKLNH